jgi:hypothetical protein
MPAFQTLRVAAGALCVAASLAASCPAETVAFLNNPALRSEPLGADNGRFTITFANNGDTPLNLFWMDSTPSDVPKEHPRGTISPGATFPVSTYLGDAYRFKATEGTEQVFAAEHVVVASGKAASPQTINLSKSKKSGCWKVGAEGTITRADSAGHCFARVHHRSVVTHETLTSCPNSHRHAAVRPSRSACAHDNQTGEELRAAPQAPRQEVEEEPGGRRLAPRPCQPG